jgi:hypothetical protein
MSLSAKALERLLDKSEFGLVERTRRGKLAGEKDEDLRDLARTLRQRRDKARTVARQQRREFRGKAPPQSTRPATDNQGSKAKADALTVALKRVGAEQTRRAEKLRAPSQRSLARKALALKQRERAVERPASRTASKGMRPVENEKAAKSGALRDAGARPAMMRAKIART